MVNTRESRHRIRTLVGLAALGWLMGVLVLTITPVFATNNVTDDHWHSEAPTFRIADSVPSSWDTSINNAGIEWNDDTDISLTQVQQGGTTIFYKELSYCTPYVPACSYVYAPSGHISSGQIEFNSNETFADRWSTAACGDLEGDDIQVFSIAQHEFGHYAGWLDNLTGGGETGDVMYWVVECDTGLEQHDINSMNEQYTGSH